MCDVGQRQRFGQVDFDELLEIDLLVFGGAGVGFGKAVLERSEEKLRHFDGDGAPGSEIDGRTKAGDVVHRQVTISVVYGQDARVSRRKKREPDAELFGAIVRELRDARGCTQEELAERAGMNASYLGFVERGDNVPTLTIIIQIAAGLGVEPAELLRELMTRR